MAHSGTACAICPSGVIRRRIGLTEYEGVIKVGATMKSSLFLPSLHGLSAFALAGLTLLVAACDSGGAPATPCSQLCACVQKEAGTKAFNECSMECEDLHRAGGSEHQCRDITRRRGVPQCVDSCAAFPATDSTESPADMGTGGSTLDDAGADSGGRMDGVNTGVRPGGGNGADNTGANIGGHNGDDGVNSTGSGFIPIPIPDAGVEPGGEFASCDREQAAAVLGSPGQRWFGEPPWTNQELEACLATCPQGEFSCIESMCTGGDLFIDCYTGELGYCAAGEVDAPCTTEWQDVGCCVEAENCGSSQPDLEECLGAGGPCYAYVQTFARCSNSDSGCASSAINVCVARE